MSAKTKLPPGDLQRSIRDIATRYKVSPLRVNGSLQGQDLASVLDATLATMAENVTDPEVQRRASELFAAANGGSREAVLQLNALRIEGTRNLLLPALRIIPAFFTIDVLGDEERPVWQNETDYEVNVRQVSQDGRRGFTTRLVKPQTETLIDLQELATDTIRYPIRDTYLGNTQPANSARANINLARDFAAKLDRIALNFLGTLFGTWSFSAGAKQDRVAVPHSYIDAANLPKSNDIVLDLAYLDAIGITRASRVVNSATTGLRQEVFDAITAYVTAWGEAMPAGFAVQPTGVLLIPSSDVVSISNSLTLDGAKGSDIAEQLKSEGFARVTWLGRQYTLVPSASLPPKKLLVPMTQPIGKMFLKGSMDWEETVTNVRENFEERSQGKTYGLYGPTHWRPFALRIQYRS